MNKLSFTISSRHNGHDELMNAESHLFMLRSQIADLEKVTLGSVHYIENELKSKSDEINSLKETIRTLHNELSALKDSFLYFNVSDDMDAEERIKYQQQFIQQEIEIINLRESNKQLQHLLDKYRAQTDIKFIEARRLAENESMTVYIDKDMEVMAESIMYSDFEDISDCPQTENERLLFDAHYDKQKLLRKEDPLYIMIPWSRCLDEKI